LFCLSDSLKSPQQQQQQQVVVEFSRSWKRGRWFRLDLLENPLFYFLPFLEVTIFQGVVLGSIPFTDQCSVLCLGLSLLCPFFSSIEREILFKRSFDL
jgi:hypothetical protein